MFWIKSQNKTKNISTKQFFHVCLYGAPWPSDYLLLVRGPGAPGGWIALLVAARLPPPPGPLGGAITGRQGVTGVAVAGWRVGVITVARAGGWAM